MELTGIRQKVFLDRYALKNEKGSPIETTPEQMWKRVSTYVASNEKNAVKRHYYEKEFYGAMTDFKFVPGGRVLSGAGTGYGVSYYNCFVIPSPKDSRDGILETLKQMVEIMARGGGVGINISSLRPRGSRVRKVNGFASGPCNWAELFSVATKDIIQQGGTRRGALMLMLWDWHPDIEEFITVKQDLSRINGANLSVCVSDSFMKAVEEDGEWALVFPDTKDKKYNKLWNGDLDAWKKAGGAVIILKTVKARVLWELIAKAAWQSAEPGVVFMERYNRLHNNWYWNKVICVNPCGEEGLPAWGVCNLASINLSALVKNADDTDVKGEFDFETLKKLVPLAIRFQDNIVDLDSYAFGEIKNIQLGGERRIGLGTMGLGDALIKLHLKYGSDEALAFCDKIYKIIRDEAYKASAEIASEKGAFPKFIASKYLQGQFVKKLPLSVKSLIKKHGVRNSILLMQAPTGTTSLLSNTSSGIEPVYEFEFTRNDRLGKHVIRHHIYEAWYQKHRTEIENGSVKRPEWFVSANDLTPEEHVKMQAVIQLYVDASISKTVNAPKSHTVEDVQKLYTLAYTLGLKGIAYMREGSRPGVLEREKPKPEVKSTPSFPIMKKKPRPYVVHGATYQINTPVGKAFITINTNGHNEPLEVFINVGKAGSDVTAMAEALGRMISLNLRFNTHLTSEERLKEIVAECSGIGGSRSIGFGKDRVRSLPDAVAKVLSAHFTSLYKGEQLTVNEQKAHYTNGTTNGFHTNNVSENYSKTPILIAPEPVLNNPLFVPKHTPLYDICPECGVNAFADEEGCKKCHSCGFSEC